MVEGDKIEIPDSHRHSEGRRSSQDTLGHKFERTELKTELNHIKGDIPNIKVVSAKSRNNLQENSTERQNYMFR